MLFGTSVHALAKLGVLLHKDKEPPLIRRDDVLATPHVSKYQSF